MCAQRPLCHSKIPTWITHRAPTDCVRGSKQKRVVTQSLAPNRDRADSRGLNCAFGYLAWKLGDPRSISRQRSSPRRWKVARTFPWEPIEKRVDRAEGPRDDVARISRLAAPSSWIAISECRHCSTGTEITGWFSREKFRTRFLRRLKKRIYKRAL